MNSTRYSNDAPYVAATLTAIFFVGALLWRIFCPLTADDFLYSMVYPADDGVYGQHISGWGDILVSIKRHYLFNNGRLANILAYPVMMMPTFLRALLCALAVTALPLLIVVFAGGRRRLCDPLTLAAAFVLTWLLFPWRNVMQSADFLLNYVFSVDAVLLCMVLWRRPQTWRRLNMLWYLPLLALSLWMHEASACCFIAWAIVASLLSRCLSPLRAIAFIVALAALAVCFSPGTLHRVNNDVHFSLTMSPIARITTLPVALYMFLLLCMAVARRLRRRDWRYHLPLLAGALCCVAIQMATKAGIRSFWIAIAFSLAGMLTLWLDGPRQRVGRKTSLWLSGVAAVALAAFSANLAYWTWRVADDQRRVLQEVERTGSNLVFVDVTDKSELSGFTLVIPYADSFNNFSHSLFMAWYMGLGNHPVTALPEAWRDVDFDKWPAIPGRNNFRGLDSRAYVTDNPDGYYGATAVYGDNMTGRGHVARGILAMSRLFAITDTGMVYINAPIAVVGRADTLYTVSHHNASRWYFGRPLKKLDVKP